MTQAPRYPRRLIEVDLPIKRISAHARREKSIRHGHISTLHIWWARRPLAACRAVLCAALWPDPTDELCPQQFRVAAVHALTNFAEAVSKHTEVANLTDDDFLSWMNVTKPEGRLNADNVGHWGVIQDLLLRFIAAFSAWEASVESHFLETARRLTQAAHEALGGEPGTRPLVVDPFAGGGSIPLEALRIGADAFASDLNPVAVLLNKVVLEYIPRYGNAEIRMHDAEGEEVVFQGLAEAVRYWGDWVREQAERELAEFYPADPDGAIPIAYLWARTIRCEGPGCGAEVPLMRSLWLARRSKRPVALRLVPQPDKKRVDFEIADGARARDVADGTVRRGSATCPCCGFTTPVDSVRGQLKARRGGAADARLFCVVITRPGETGRSYRLPTERDFRAAQNAAAELERRRALHIGQKALVPDEELDIRGIRLNWCMLYGIGAFGDMFLPRQALAIATLAQRVAKLVAVARLTGGNQTLTLAVQSLLAMAVDSCADHNCSLCSWRPYTLDVSHVFGRQAMPMAWDLAETVSTGTSTGAFSTAVDKIARVITREASAGPHAGASVHQLSATDVSLPDDSAQAVFTDPPYYDSVPYAFLSDFFHVWLHRMLGEQNGLFTADVVPKEEEIVVDRPHELSPSRHDVEFYEGELTRAFGEARRVLRPDGLASVVFASKTTTSWEAVVQAVVSAGWVITASWPVDTEMATKLAAIDQARLMSSVHLVCRPRETPDGSLREEVGDWRDVLQELPGRIHEWLPRLAREGIVGADAIFACLGPALEVFSRYSHVEKTSGETVTLSEYLEHVWATVAREALDMIFSGADTTGFEEDARLTAMWLWTLSTGANGNGKGRNGTASSDDDEALGDQDGNGAAATPRLGGGYTLEYDAARKIAQGLGAHLERLANLVEVKGSTARLLPVAERTRYLFGRDVHKPAKPKKRQAQRTLFEELSEIEDAEPEWGDLAAGAGKTVLDHIHQSMILFAAGRSAALRQFLVDQGHGRDERFWRLAQALSALYPTASDEKRWVDGVLARKKGLGL